jgi:hypothetical protein
MTIPNWQHHSNKQPKGKRKVRLIQQSKQQLKHLKAKYGITG